MGNYLSYFYDTNNKNPVFLCDEDVNDFDMFIIRIHMHTLSTITEDNVEKILEFLAYTNSNNIYYIDGQIFMSFIKDQKPAPVLRSTHAGNLISYLSSEVTKFILENTNIKLVRIGVEISV